MPFHEVEIKTSNQNSVTVEYYEKKEHQPHSQDEPIFLIDGYGSNGMKLLLPLAEILKDDLKIPNSVYIYEEETHHSTISAENALELSAEYLANEIKEKLSKSANTTACLIMVTSWKSFEVMLAANLISKEGYKPPILYIVNGLPAEEAQAFFSIENKKIAFEEICKQLNHLAKLYSLHPINIDDHFIRQSLVDLENYSVKKAIDFVKKLILKNNTGIVDISVFKNYVENAKEAMFKLLNYRSKDQNKSLSNVYLLFTNGLIKEFNISHYYGWDRYAKLNSIFTIKDKKLINLDAETLFDRNNALNLANSLIAHFVPLTIISLKKALYDFQKTVAYLSLPKEKKTGSIDQNKLSSSTSHSDDSIITYSDWALGEQTESESIGKNLTVTSSSSPCSPVSYQSLVSSDEHEPSEKSSLNSPEKTNSPFKPAFFPLPKSAVKYDKQVFMYPGFRSPQSLSDFENQESKSNSPSTFASFVSPASSLKNSSLFSGLPKSPLNSPIISPVEDDQQKMIDLNLSAENNVTDLDIIQLEEEKIDRLNHEEDVNAIKYYLFKR